IAGAASRLVTTFWPLRMRGCRCRACTRARVASGSQTLLARPSVTPAREAWRERKALVQPGQAQEHQHARVDLRTVDAKAGEQRRDGRAQIQKIARRHQQLDELGLVETFDEFFVRVDL